MEGRIVQKLSRMWKPRFILPISITLISLLLIYYFVRPIPPDTLNMTTGMEGGSFVVFAEQYRQILARDGIRVNLVPSSGMVENLRLLGHDSHGVDASFVQGVIDKKAAAKNLMSLGSLTYTPLWVFYRGEEILDDLSQLRGKRIAVGPKGSGIQKLSLNLLKAAHAADRPTILYEYSYSAAMEAILAGRTDAVMVLGSADSQVVTKLLHTNGIRLMNFSQAEAYTRLFPVLSHVVLPRGVLSLEKRLPPSDVHLLSPTANLIVRKGLHPALVYLLLEASVEIHSGAGWVHKAGEFPSLNKQDYPVSEQAERYYRSGGSSLYHYLPFWAATFIDRMILVLIPLGILLFPVIGVLPRIYTWRNRSKYYRWYRELSNIERELLEYGRPESLGRFQENLDRIEKAVGDIRVSVGFYDQVFTLKEHIQMVRQKLFRLKSESPEKLD
ncbi:MAG: ABC transporter substrate-binding protein [Deltaproteobacteria bacterium]|nr:ABC transporter substrate-binding protein [Deltaproteobacteria bacterium]